MLGVCLKDNAVEETPDTKDSVYYIKLRVKKLDDKNPTSTPTVFFSTSVPANMWMPLLPKLGICILKQPFESVIAIPEASAFKTAKDLVGTDDAGAFGVGAGWYRFL